jgi:hypothetical protein
MSNVRRHMKDKSFRASSAWFSSLAALLVALGSETLLNAITPASLTDLQFGTPDITVIHRAGGWSLWAIEATIRLLSFALGGTIGVLLARALSSQLLAMLLLIAVLATVFQQLPGSGPVPWLVVWSLLAPTGIAFGAWVASARQSDA